MLKERQENDKPTKKYFVKKIENLFLAKLSFSKKKLKRKPKKH